MKEKSGPIGTFFVLTVRFLGLKICEAHKTHIFQDNVEKILEQKGIMYIYNILQQAI